MTNRPLLPAALALALAAATAASWAAGEHRNDRAGSAAIGAPGEASRVARTIDVDMTDAMRFTPSGIDVKQGETVRFVVRNSGRLVHEMVLGTPAMLQQHSEMMMKMPGMEHAEPNQATVAPGASGELIWRFDQAGRVDFACLQPGHFEAGMKGFVDVAAAAR